MSEIVANTGLTLEKLLAAKKLLDANEYKYTYTDTIEYIMGFKFVRSYWSIRGAAKALRISRKRARWMELNGRIAICRH